MKIKVLIIEDEPVIAEMISMILEDEGFEVISLSDTGWARYKLQAKEVNLVMLDLQLKGGEGGESICKYIKTTHDLKNIPVILVSGSEDIEEIKEKCGADDLIRKPFELNHFISKVHKHTGVIN
ncbi:MAG TPA: response regulator [Mucilaginibacter sp.]|jgi:DNA-binding response OmpR family regulator|nr:response regulator [Mucilaginibacter sp.]